MARYEAVPHRYWRHLKTGQTASLLGALPYMSESQAAEWRVVQNGYTVHDNLTNCRGIASCPAGSSLEHAQGIADQLNAMNPTRVH